MKRTGRRLVCATAAAVTILVAPGPTDEVATQIRRRWCALAYAAAAKPIDCSFCPRHVGSWSRAS